MVLVGIRDAERRQAAIEKQVQELAIATAKRDAVVERMVRRDSNVLLFLSSHVAICVLMLRDQFLLGKYLDQRARLLHGGINGEQVFERLKQQRAVAARETEPQVNPLGATAVPDAVLFQNLKYFGLAMCAERVSGCKEDRVIMIRWVVGKLDSMAASNPLLYKVLLVVLRCAVVLASPI
jgi:hypothetical protein